jgi:ribosomal-protein-alanine N-acetyltransferase
MIISNQGKSLHLRQTEPKDAPILLKAYEDESFIRLYRSNNVTPKTEEQLAEGLKKRTELHPAQLGYLEFMIEHKQHGAIGVAAFGDYAPYHKRAEFLIGLFEEQHQSRGYGAEATLLMLDLAFNVYNLNKIYTYVYDYNKKSEKLTERFGFKKEGYLESHHYSIREQGFVDLYINGLTLANFRTHKKLSRISKLFIGRDITQAPTQINLNEDVSPVENEEEMKKRVLEGLQSMARQC